MSEFKTTDTALATFLITAGYPVANIDYSQPRYEYAFDDSLEIRQLSDKYLTGNALADPAAIIRVNKKLLRIIKNQLQWGDEG